MDVSKEMYGTVILNSSTRACIMGNIIFTYIPIIILLYSYSTNAQRRCH